MEDGKKQYRSVQVRRDDPDDLKENESIFTVNTEGEDRHGTVINPMGGNFEHFRKNPVVLWEHGMGTEELPVARVNEIETSENEIRMRVEFDDEDPPSARIMGKVKRGFLHGASIGFIPETIDESTSPPTIDEWEMAELSLTSVPSNRDALVEIRSAQIQQFTEALNRFTEAINKRANETDEPEEEDDTQEEPTSEDPQPQKQSRRRLTKKDKLRKLALMAPKIRTQVRKQLGKA